MAAPPVPRLTNQEINPVPLIIWASVLIVAVVIGGLIITYLRRRMLGNSQRAAAGSFLEEMRNLRAKGLISDAELSAARKAVVRATERAPVPATDSDAAEKLLNAKPSAARGGGASKPAATRRTPNPTESEKVAPPGFDLTGAPLPKLDKLDPPHP